MTQKCTELSNTLLLIFGSWFTAYSPLSLSPDIDYEPVNAQSVSPPPVPRHQVSTQSQQSQPHPQPQQQTIVTVEQTLLKDKNRSMEVSPVLLQETTSVETEHLYESISPSTKDKPNEYAKLSSLPTNVLPDDVESLADLSIEYLANVDPRKAQLWMLLQMQKMVQKIENVYETVGYYTRPPEQLPPTTQGNTAKFRTENQTSRGQHYVNLSEISKAASQLDRPLPPLPPKTYKDQESAGDDNDVKEATEPSLSLIHI